MKETNFPEVLYFNEALSSDAPFAGTPDLEGQEKLARDCGYAPEDVDYLVWSTTKIDLLRAGRDMALYGRIWRVGSYPCEVWRAYYTASRADDGYYDIRWIRDVKINNGRGVRRSVRGYR